MVGSITTKVSSFLSTSRKCITAANTSIDNSANEITKWMEQCIEQNTILDTDTSFSLFDSVEFLLSPVETPIMEESAKATTVNDAESKPTQPSSDADPKK